jgi:hypothetical protein
MNVDFKSLDALCAAPLGNLPRICNMSPSMHFGVERTNPKKENGRVF